MDGFSRILEKKLSELLCTRLYNLTTYFWSTFLQKAEILIYDDFNFELVLVWYVAVWRKDAKQNDGPIKVQERRKE